MEEEILNGCLGIGEADTDYLLDGVEVDKLPNLYNQDEVIYQYNQANQDWSKKSCTIFSAVGAVSDLFNYKFSLDEIKEIDDMSYTLTRVKGEGWYVKSAVDLVAKWWNNNKKLTDKYGKVVYYRLSKYSPELIDKVASKGYTICVGYYGNKAYNDDYRADCVLNGTKFGVHTYGHATNLRKKGRQYIKDSYEGKKYNIYELEHNMSEISVFQEGAYVYTSVKQDSLEEVKRLEALKTKVMQVIELNSSIRHLVNDTTYKNKLHEMNNANRKKLEDVERELKKYQ